MKYTIVPLEQDPEVRGAYRAVSGMEVVAHNTADARDAIKRAYKRFGVIPAVFDDSGKVAHLFTNEEVAKWGLDAPDLF